VSTPVRPSGGSLSPGVTGIDGATELEPSKPSAVAEAGAAARLGEVQAPAVEGSTAGVIARLQAGELTREQAIDALVAQALELHGGARLPAPQRAELSAVLRDALLHDPALARLLG
jgi:hypothetical protein